MRKPVFVAVSIVGLVGVSWWAGAVRGQAGKSEDAELNAPHRIGLLDASHIFQKYEKFVTLRDGLKDDIQVSENQAKQKEAKIRDLVAKIKSFAEGSPDYVELEKQIEQAKADFTAFRTTTEKDIFRQEAKVYHTIHQEIQDAVDRYCKSYGYTLVLRFRREDMNSTDPQKVMQNLNQPVVFHREMDDLTDSVLKFLNTRYANAGGGASGKKATPPANRIANPPVDKKSKG